MHAEQDLAIFPLTPSSTLVEAACRIAGAGGSAGMELREFEDGEHKTRPLDSVRGRDVFVVGSLHSDGKHSVNDLLARALFFLATLRDAGAARLTLVAPYLCYMRKDRRTKPRDPVTSRYVATLLESVQLDRIVTIDVHNPAAYENAFRIQAVHLTAAHLLVGRIANEVGERDVTVVSPDAGGAKRSERFRQFLEVALQRPVNHAFVEKYRSEGQVTGGLLVGEVRGRTAVIVDDLVSSGTTLVRAARACRDGGAERVVAAVTHGVFSAAASENLADPMLERLFATDTVPSATSGLGARVEIVAIAPLLGTAIRRLHDDSSLHELTDLSVPDAK